MVTFRGHISSVFNHSTRTLNCPDCGPPPTCPFIQPTMRKSSSHIQTVRPEHKRHCSGLRFIGETVAAIWFETRKRTRWFVPASGEAYGPRLSPRQHLFLRVCRSKPPYLQKPARWRQRRTNPFSRACAPLPLSGWTGTSFEAPVRREF